MGGRRTTSSCSGTSIAFSIRSCSSMPMRYYSLTLLQMRFLLRRAPPTLCSSPARMGHAGYGSSCTGGCTASGLNTHLMLLQPNRTVDQELLQKAVAGDYIPFTNTEQDVLENFFCNHEDGSVCAGQQPQFDLPYKGEGTIQTDTRNTSAPRGARRLWSAVSFSLP